jgi:hypothetical protein
LREQLAEPHSLGPDRFAAGGLVCLFALLCTASLQSGLAVVAGTDLGPVTIADLELQVRHGPGLPEGTLEEEADWRHAERLMRVCALEQILGHMAQSQGLDEDPGFRAWVEVQIEYHLVALAEQRLVPPPNPATDDEAQAFVAENRELFRLAPRIAWRFMLFRNEESDAQAGRAMAGSAMAALASGEDFEDVARRLASPPESGTHGQLLVSTGDEETLLPSVREALLSTPVGGVNPPIAIPRGWAIVRVESRELERFPAEDQMMIMARQALGEARWAENRARVVEELRRLLGLEIHDPLILDMPDDTPAMEVGESALTLGDLRQRAEAFPDPQAELERLITPDGLQELGERLLFIQGLERSEDAAAIDLAGVREHRRRALTAERMRWILRQGGANELSGDLEETLLREYNYHRLLDGRLLRFGESGHLVVIEPME